MDRAFLIAGLKALIPITLIFCLFFNFTIMTGDADFHIQNRGQYDYPPAVSWMLEIGEVVLHLDRWVAYFMLMLATTTVIPYLLIVAIVSKHHKDWGLTAGWVYLYGSGIPFCLFFGGVAAQALIGVMMLFAIFEPMGLFLLLIIGPYVYREWILALGASAVYVVFQYLKPRIEARWYN